MLIRVSFVFISLIILAIIVNSFWSQPPMVTARDNKSKYVQVNIKSTQEMEQSLEQPEVTEPEPIESEEEPEEELIELEEPEPVKELIETPAETIKPDPLPVVKKPTFIKPVIEPVEKPSSAPPASETTPIEQMASSPDDQYIEDLAVQYKLQLSAWLQKYKRYPLIAKKRHYEGMVKVKFSIDDRGHLLEYEIIEPSRHKSLNDAVVKMLQKSSPMPDVPHALHNREGIYEYQVPILFELKAGR